MPTYVHLASWTDKGAASFKDTLERAGDSNKLMAKFGGSLKEVYWTMGAHDIVAISEAPDDESATAFALALATWGTIRTETMRAFDADEMKAIVAKTE